MSSFDILHLHPAANHVEAIATETVPAWTSPAIAEDQPEVVEQSAFDAPDPNEADAIVINAGQRRKGPVCGCLNRMRATMAAQNGEPGIDRLGGGAIIYVRKMDRAGIPPPFVVASFCPFCGEGYA